MGPLNAFTRPGTSVPFSLRLVLILIGVGLLLSGLSSAGTLGPAPETPEDPEIRVETGRHSIDESLRIILAELEKLGLVRRAPA